MGIIKSIFEGIELLDNVSKKVAKTKEDEKKKIVENAKKLCKYAKRNLEDFCDVVYEKEDETRILIEKIKDYERSGLTIKTKMKVKKLTKSAIENLKYLYLAKEYFLILYKILCDAPLNEEQYTFIVKFTPFFEGEDVLSLSNKDEEDGTLLDSIKEFGKNFSKEKEFNFNVFLGKYIEKIKNLIIPNFSSIVNHIRSSK